MTDYDTDFALWAAEQAALLRIGRLDDLDRENLAEEIDNLARSLRRELFSRFVRLLQNLLHWEYLPLVRLPAWYIAIQEERAAIPLLLADAPSMSRDGLTSITAAWKVACEQASYATGLKLGVFPPDPSYTNEEALDAAFWPGGELGNGLERFRIVLRPSAALAAHGDEVRQIVEAHHATNPRVFGSVARGEDSPGSDLDLLVDPLPGLSLLDLSGMTAGLEELLGVKVDVVTPNALPGQSRAQVLSEAAQLADLLVNVNVSTREANAAGAVSSGTSTQCSNTGQPAPESHWNYRVMEFNEGGEMWREFREVHYRNGAPAGYSSVSASPCWDEDNEAAMRILDRMRDALAKPLLRPEDFRGRENSS